MALNVYESTRTPGTLQKATPGSAADRRFARSGRWRLIGSEHDGLFVEPDPAARARAEYAAASRPEEPGEPGTFDGPPSAQAQTATEEDAEG